MTLNAQGTRGHDPPVSLAGSVQLLHRIRRMLARAHDNSDASALLGNLSSALTILARTTRTAKLTIFSSITLHVLEQLRPMARAQHLSHSTRNALLTWINLSLAYLRSPASWSCAAVLVEHMGHRYWERPVDRAHRDALLAGLRRDVDSEARL